MKGVIVDRDLLLELEVEGAEHMAPSALADDPVDAILAGEALPRLRPVRTSDASRSTVPCGSERRITMRATGTFDVELKQQSTVHPEAGLGRRSIEKQFFGDLEATSKGEMLSAGGQVKGSAGYVALELVTGRLGGKSGSFALQHFGLMKRGEGTLKVTVVPDSGTGELAGLSGSLTIVIADGKHEYVFEYDLEHAP